MTAAPGVFGGRILLSGVIAGAATSFGFAGLHHLLISDIWFSLVPMMVAGALCGLCLAWSYRVLFERPTRSGWLRYNLEFVVLFILLGGVSFLLYEPVYTLPGLSAGLESADALLRQALSLSAMFGIVAGAAISLVRGRTAQKATAIIVTCLALTVLLGHNAAILGLVHMTKEMVPVLAEFYGLTAAIMVGNAGLFMVLERRGLFSRGPS
jgi:hypothetical protein